MATTVTWTQDGNGNYEVSSAEHLKQIMNKGALYTDVGTFPTDYWASGTNYKQTADIDLLSISTDIKPIGNSSEKYVGEYDGGEFSISNWSYTDPNFTSTTVCETSVGVFGYTDESVIKNMRLTGVFSVQGFHSNCGFLVGYAEETDIFNIVCDFDVGTNITRGDATTTSTTFSFAGGVVGRFSGVNPDRSLITGVNVAGSIDLIINGIITSPSAGGMVGNMTRADASLLRLAATFPSGISGNTCGGITASASSSIISNSINNMTGNITGITNAGGICGSTSGATAVPPSLNNVVNSMTGDISSTTDGKVGGILGSAILTTLGYYSFFNYMKGDIFSTANTYAGGLIGDAYINSPVSITLSSSINAMNGNVEESVVGRVNSSHIENVVATVDTSFGLTYTSNTSGTSTALTGFLTVTEFPDLPYFSISGTDNIGNTYDYDFVYANLGGNLSYSTTHLIISQGQATFQNGSVIIVTLPLSVTPNVGNIPIAFTEVTGAIGYNITYEGPTGGEVTAFSDVTTLEHNITGLVPETQYTIKLYADTGTGYELTEELTTTTLANVATNYDKQDYTDGGFFNLRSLVTSALSAISQVWNGVFDTGDVIGVSVPKKSEFKGSFVNLGDTLPIKEINGVILPFESSTGNGQAVTITLSDDTTDVPVLYDDTANTITVNGIVYGPGESFILDGRKVTVLDV